MRFTKFGQLEPLDGMAYKSPLKETNKSIWFIRYDIQYDNEYVAYIQMFTNTTVQSIRDLRVLPEESLPR